MKKKMKNVPEKQGGQHWQLWLIAAPGILYLLINNYIPMMGVFLAFKDFNYMKGVFGSDWCGFKNFEFLFKTKDAFIMTRNTLLYNAAFIVIGTIFAIFVAILLSELGEKLRTKFFQASLLLPNLLSWVIIGIVGYAFLNADNGFLDKTVLPALGLDSVAWYSNPQFWPFILILVFLWKNTGYTSIIYMAGISGSLIRIEEELRSLEDGTTVVSFDRNLEGKAFLLKAESEEQLQLQQQEYIEKIKDIMEKYEHVRYFGGIGRPVNRLRELPASFEQASHAFAHRYLVQDSRILDGGYLAQGTEEEHFDIKQVNPKQIDRTRIQEFLKQGDREEVVYFVEEFFRDLSNKALQSNIFRQYITMDAYFCVADFLESLSTDTQDPETPSQDEKTQQDSDSAIQYIIRILDKALEARDRVASSRYDDVVEQVMKYIEENYAEEELSLNLLASHVNFSPNHLSMIFSQQTGMSFIKYLTDYRMNKAKELLRCTGKRSSLISQEVGYKDPHYFSYLFKKTQGMTPTQYRGGIK